MSLKKIAANAASLAVAVFVAFVILRSFNVSLQQVVSHRFNINFLSLGGLLLFVSAVPVSGLLWGQLLTRLSGKRVNAAESIRVHISSWLLKYVPGQVGSYVGKLKWGIENGFSKTAVTSSFAYENILLASSSILVPLPILAYYYLDKILGQASLFLPLLILLPFLVVTVRPVFMKLTNVLLKLFGKKQIGEQYFLGSSELLNYQFKFLAPRLMNAAGFVMIVLTVTPTDPSLYPAMGAAYVLAGIVGILTFFVPSGIGVRESVILLFLSPALGVPTAAFVAILARLYATLADVALAVIYAYMTWTAKRN